MAALAHPPLDRDPSIARRIMRTLEACASSDGALTLTELAVRTGLAKSTLHRTCWRLVELGLLEHADDGFSIGVKMFAMGNANPVLSDIRAAAMPALLGLHVATGGMSNLAILHEGEAFVVDALFAHAPALPRLVGGALPLHCTAVGKAIASTFGDRDLAKLLDDGSMPPATRRTIVRPPLLRAQLGRIAQDGLAVSDEEYMLGICGVAAPLTIRGRATVAIGFVGACGPAVVRRASGPVRQAAVALKRALERSEFPSRGTTALSL
jgi:DNA-binding IclR family transcriptional regulator